MDRQEEVHTDEVKVDGGHQQKIEVKQHLVAFWLSLFFGYPPQSLT